MNSVFLSPHFPPNFAHFAVQLKAAGANVLGLADEPFESLSPELKNSLTEYYRVSNMHDYGELVRALGYFTHRYGKLDHLDSHNEYWLETEARLRTDFNIEGIDLNHIQQIKRKSKMKRKFVEAGLSPARGRVCNTEQEVLDLIEEVGYPVVAKPDIGVGAAKTFKMNDHADLRRFLCEKSPEDYIVEEFIAAPIVTFDGLVDRKGQIIFSSSLKYSRGIMETVNEDSDIYYHTVREIEPDVEKAGLQILKAFDVKARFFHFEFFCTPYGEIIPLEVNMRPPGGLTLNMFNYIFDFDCYKAWAEMIVKDISAPAGDRLYFVIYVGRKNHIHYLKPHNEVVDDLGPLIQHHEPINSIFAPAIGNYGYILRSPALPPLIEAADVILQRNSAG